MSAPEDVVNQVAAFSDGRGVLMIEHGWGGGVGAHVSDLSARLAGEGVPVLRAVPAPGGLSISGAGSAHTVAFSWADRTEATQLLQRLRLGRVHVHSLVGLPLEELAPLLGVIAEAGLTYDFTCHDYAPVCPRLNMADWGGVYCDNRSVAHCQVCLEKAGSPFGQVDVATWRTVYAQVLEGARRVFAPDPDVAERMNRLLPAAERWRVRAHPPLRSWSGRSGPGASPSHLRRIAVVGAIGPEKGSGLLVRLAADALARQLPLIFELHGYSDRRVLAEFPNVRVMGRYAETDIDDRLAQTRPDLFLHPAVVPETFCYALDIAFRNGIWPVCFDLGAQSRRVRDSGFGDVFPLDWAFDPSRMNDALVQLNPGCGAHRPTIPAERRWTSAEAYYER